MKPLLPDLKLDFPDEPIRMYKPFLARSSIVFIRGKVTSLDANRRRVRITTDTEKRGVAFDQAVYALGSNIDLDVVPGAAVRLATGLC